MAQAIVWAVAWGLGTAFSPENLATSHWLLKLAGGLYLGLLIGLFPAGLIFLTAYALPGAILWATASDRSIWDRFPAAACLVGAIIGIGTMQLVARAIDGPPNAWDSMLGAILLGSLYGIATAIACLVVKTKLPKNVDATPIHD
ncbi:MAG: hypothetical protein AAF191_10495 [Verrucomicrobiota bacterium]